MTGAGERVRVPAVRFQRHLPGPLSRVWDHLTQCERLVEWFGEGGVIEPQEGGRVRFLDGHVRGTVTRWEPPRRLTYSWNVFGPGESLSPYPESYLGLDLTQMGASVTLDLSHLPVLERFEAQNAMGWHTFLDMLEARLRGEAVQERRIYMEKNARLYGVDLTNLEP